MAKVRHQLPGAQVRGREKVANATFVKVVLNDVVRHQNVETKRRAPGGLTRSPR
ncbi:hypothetical protein [Gemmata obscuriglobus]|uniref:hypothetical protein n=1 Tax=Gemmata obscuriglobus TaxID=114 RepID=UPI00030CC4CC|nr:hypothetical protein [Gemmata obscuriglobus]